MIVIKPERFHYASYVVLTLMLWLHIEWCYIVVMILLRFYYTTTEYILLHNINSELLYLCCSYVSIVLER